jgi:protein-tyrosine phosphatase
LIDLHTHILPGIDDGSKTLEMSLEMARMAVEDGTTILACTPHIYPGLYMNTQEGIKAECAKLQKALDVFQIPLKLVVGADAHLVPELLEGLKSGRVPTLNDSRYFLLEPSHHVPPPNFEESVFQISAAGYHPVLTHPERLVWIEQHYATFVRLAQRGVWMQLTAVPYWASLASGRVTGANACWMRGWCTWWPAMRTRFRCAAPRWLRRGSDW